MKKYLSITVGLVLLPLLAFAVNDVTLYTDSELLVGGYTLVVSGSNSTIDSITVNASDFTVTLSPNSTFRIKSTDRRRLVVDPLTYVRVDNTCSSSESIIALTPTQDSGSITVTITPSTSQTCSALQGGGAPSGGAGAVAVIAPVAPAITPAAPAVARPSAVALVVSPVFNKDLVRGSRSDEVKRLQQLLATDSEVYPEGLTTGYYGLLTEKAVRKFQLKYGVIRKATDPGNGRCGPKTRTKIQEVFGDQALSVVAAKEAQKTAMESQIKQLQDTINTLLKQVKQLKK
jgi:hypothetical protein